MASARSEERSAGVAPGDFEVEQATIEGANFYDAAMAEIERCCKEAEEAKKQP